MRALELSGDVDQNHQLKVDLPAYVSGPKRVKIIVLIPEHDNEIEEQEWHQQLRVNDVFNLLNDSAEDIYTEKDGKPFKHSI